MRLGSKCFILPSELEKILEPYPKNAPLIKKKTYFLGPPSLSEMKVGDNPAEALLNAISVGSCKNVDDEKLCYDVAHALILKLGESRSHDAENKMQVCISLN